MTTTEAVVKRPSAYSEFDVRRGTLAGLPHPTRKQALSVAKRVWRRAVGKPWPGTWSAGRGNHRTYPRGWKFLVNPGQGWAELIHDMSHEAYSQLTRCTGHYKRICSEAKLLDYKACGWGRENKHHNANHAALERQMVAHALELILGHVWVKEPGRPEQCKRCKTSRHLGDGAQRQCVPWP